MYPSIVGSLYQNKLCPSDAIRSVYSVQCFSGASVSRRMLGRSLTQDMSVCAERSNVRVTTLHAADKGWAMNGETVVGVQRIFQNYREHFSFIPVNKVDGDFILLYLTTKVLLIKSETVGCDCRVAPAALCSVAVGQLHIGFVFPYQSDFVVL